MGKHFQFGDDGDATICKDNGSDAVGFKIDRRGGGNFSFGSRGRGGWERGDDGPGRGRGREDGKSRGGGYRDRGSGRGSFRGRGGGSFRGRGRGRGDGKFRGGSRGRGGGGHFSNFKSYGDNEAEENEKLGTLPDETMAYYRQVSATVEAGFDDEDPDSKKNFLDNVFIAVKDDGVKVSQNQTVSHILEGLLPHSSPAHLRILFFEFSNHLPTVSFDRFASHVFQTLIQYIPNMYDDDELEEENKNSLKALLRKLCDYFLSEIKQFLTDTYGSHVLRSLLEVLGGVQIKEEVIRSHSSQKKRNDIGGRKNLQLKKNVRFSKELTSDFESEFDVIKSKVVTILSEEGCEATAHLTDPNFCLVLQTILLILYQTNLKEYREIAQKLMDRARPLSAIKTEDDDGENDNNDGDTLKNLPSIVQDSVGSFLIELLVSHSLESDITRIYETVFKGTLSEYALHPVANYVLQTLCSSLTKNSDILTQMVTEICPCMEDILACNHMGVITKVAEACQGNGALQKIFTKAVMAAFHCNLTEEKRKKVTPLVASLTVYEVYFPSQNQGEEEEEEVAVKSSSKLLKSVTLHGSLLLQQMLRFNKPKYVVMSLLGLTPVELSNMASDQSGSHVVEAFFNSPSVNEVQRSEFVRKIQGHYINIACDKNGSRCLEGIWKGCIVKNKIFIAEDLLKSRQRLESDRFGRHIWYSFKMMNFATRQKDWINFQSGINKKERLLQDILEGGSNKKKRKVDEVKVEDFDMPQQQKKVKTEDVEEGQKTEKKKEKHKKVKKGKQ